MVTDRSAPRTARVDRLHHEYLAELRRAGPGDPGDQLRSYLGSPVPVLVLRVPEFRRRLRAFDRALGPLTAPELRRLLRRLAQGPTYEERLSAIELLDRRPAGWDDATWRLVDRWVDEATGWALSDSLAAGPIAGWLASDPTRFREIVRWTRSRSLWRRRAATYALHDWVAKGELDRPFALLERSLDDPEFWVRRAVGTWLRECWKRDPARTEAFLRRHVRRLSRVTITVATERTSKEFREELRTARAAATRRGEGN